MVQKINIKQNQKLVFSLAMRQALEVLQMPLQELSIWLKMQVEQNPALELKDEIADEGSIRKNHSIAYDNFIKPPSLFEFLMQQARNCFRGEDLSIAEFIIGNLDQRGFFSIKNMNGELFSKEKAQIILRTIQSFDPPGIAAADLKESLLIQLIRKGKGDTLSFKIVNECFDDLLHHRISLISKVVKCTSKEIKELIQKDLFPLNLQPGAEFDQQHTLPIIPDIILENQEGKWLVEVNRKELPAIELSLNFLKHSNSPHLSNEEKVCMRRSLASGKWLMRILGRRHQTLKQIAAILLTKHAAFFSGEYHQFSPCTLEEISQLLGMHKSTIARAIYEKYLYCPQGLFPLKRFITSSTFQNPLHSAKDLLLKFIKTEDKARPLSDEELSQKLNAQNIPCSRRTIAKYRQTLNIPPSSHRKL
ncbi:MAG TPA: RNA polymerase factor sigma-54 [Rhabdochlamydiaceae bacterium]|nr:RNA polymerase factor sigma-54 [Rhabdochlamydiaceae bacterium]